MFGAAISGIIGFLPAAFIYFFVQPPSVSSKLAICGLTAGALTVLFYYFYFKTLENDEPSVAIALNNLAPGLVPFLAFFILDEKLHVLQYVGLAMIVLGSFALTVIDLKKLRFTAAVWFAVNGAIAYALVSIFAKYAYERASFPSIYFWISTGFGVGGVVAFLLLRDWQQLRVVINRKRKKLLMVLVGVELLNMAGELIQGAAINGGPVTIVRGLEGIQPLYVLIIGIVLSRFLPNHFRERHDGRFNKKVICMIFMIAGLFMI